MSTLMLFDRFDELLETNNQWPEYILIIHTQKLFILLTTDKNSVALRINYPKTKPCWVKNQSSFVLIKSGNADERRCRKLYANFH